MPEPTRKYDPELLHRLLRDLRADFDGLRQREGPIKIRLIHRAANARAEGVSDDPPSAGSTPIAIRLAGHRDFRQYLDESGNPRFIDPPSIDANGNPVVNSAGEALEVTTSASRMVLLWGDHAAVARLQSLADRGGRLAAACRNETLRLLAGWRFGTPEELWWGLVFEFAWSGGHPLLTAKRHLWQTSEKGGLVLLPYDIEQLRKLAASPLGAIGKVSPEDSLKRLPDAYMSEIDDAASACSDLATVLADELEAAPSADNTESGPGHGVRQSAERAAVPNDKGYVARPADPSAYVPAADIVAGHTPAEMPLTTKQLKAILEDHPTNRVRWTRPPGKAGKPRPNRRSVHLTDWLAYVQRRRAGGVAADEADWPVVSEDDVAQRSSAIRRQRLTGK